MTIQVYAVGPDWKWVILGPRRVDEWAKSVFTYGSQKEAFAAACAFEERMFKLYHSQDGHIPVVTP